MTTVIFTKKKKNKEADSGMMIMRTNLMMVMIASVVRVFQFTDVFSLASTCALTKLRDFYS